jgi:opine dehydrogenase
MSILKNKKLAVIGAGNAGHAFAGHLSKMGYGVNLFDVDSQRIELLKRTGKIKMTGIFTGEYPIELITNSIEKAISGVNVIIVILPTIYHENIARLAAPFLCDDQIVILNPGATGGALEFRAVLSREGCSADVTVAETNTMIYACRAPNVGEVHVFGMKQLVYVATLPSKNASKVIEAIQEAYPQFKAVPNVLHTSLNNTTAMVHPIPMILNAGRVESGKSFEYYFDGFTPSVSSVVETLDSERLAIGKALGLELPSIVQWYKYRYGVKGEILFDTIQKVTEYTGISSPPTLNTRYLFEDIPTGLVPLAYLGKAVGVKTPIMDAAIDLGNALLHRDFRIEGRSLSKLGLSGKGIREIIEFVS